MTGGSDAMEQAVARLGEQHAELAGYLDGLDEEGWSRQSRCDDWSVADVVLHLSQTDEMALASAEHRLREYVAQVAEGLKASADVDGFAGQMVERERGRSGAEVGERWREGAARLRDALAAGDPHDRVDWVAGQLSLRTLATTRLAEAWIHTGDVAFAFDETWSATERLEPIARLAWRTVPYAFSRAGEELHGPVAFELTGPDGAAWRFSGDEPATTTVSGPCLDLCLVAGRRLDPAETALTAEGPDAERVLALVRTYA
jgi:uncharacterized protein (TIGR03084 family)